MIPLSEWLSGRHALEGEGQPHQADSYQSHDVCCERPDFEFLVEEAYQRGRRDGLMKTEACEQALREEHLRELMQCEAALNEKWSRIVSTDLAGAVTAAFLDLRLQLEESVSGTLLPFLDEVVAERATAQLMDLICGEAARNSESLLEIRSPALLHRALTERLSESGIVTSLSQSESVEVIARDARLRFESMASRWIVLLRGGDS